MAAHEVFISYSTRDRPAADAVVAALEDAGARCWIAPRDIVPGADWGASICNAIAQCRVLLLLLSCDSNESDMVKREVELAASKRILLLPFYLERVELSDALRFFLGTCHWLDASEPPLERHLKALTAAVEALLAGHTFERRPAAAARRPEQREQAALRDVDAVLGRLRGPAGPVSLERVCDVTAAAIRHGAPIYNDGSHDGCARIYLHAAKGLLEVLGPGGSPAAGPLRDARFVRDELAPVVARYPSVTAANATDAAWALRRVFDRLPMRAIVLHGVGEVNGAIEALRGAGRPPALSDAVVVIRGAIAHGNVLYQGKDLWGCAELHLHTARRLLSVAGGADEAARVLRAELGSFADVEVVDEEGAEEMAWRLYEAFLRVLKAAGVTVADSAAQV